MKNSRFLRASFSLEHYNAKWEAQSALVPMPAVGSREIAFVLLEQFHLCKVRGFPWLFLEINASGCNGAKAAELLSCLVATAVIFLCLYFGGKTACLGN